MSDLTSGPTTNPLVKSSFFSVEPVESTSSESSTPRRISATVLGQEVSTLCFCIPLTWVLTPKDGKEIEVKNSELSTVFLLLNYMIGSGIVVQAYVFRESGIVVCIFEYIIIAIMNYTGVNLLVRSAEATKVFDYSNLTHKVLGPYGSMATDISIVIGGFGSLLSYILIIGTVLTEVVKHCGGWYCNVVFLTILPITLFTLPLCLLRNFGHLAVASYISIGVISATVMLVIIGGPIVNADEHITHYRLGGFIGAIRTIGDIVFALGYITATFHSYNAMADRTVHTFNRASRNTIILGAVMCFATGLAGYLSFGEDTHSNIIENFDGTLGGIFKIALVVHLVLYIPGDFVIMRAAILKLRGLTLSDLNDAEFITLSLGCMGLVTFVALMLQVFLSNNDNLAVVVDITGGVAGSMLYFILPGSLALQLFKEDRSLYLQALALIGFGVTIMVLCIASTAF